MSTVHRQQQQQHVAQQHSFNENSPRPPVPGEECSESGSRSPAWTGPRFSHKGGSSPVLTPRRSSLAANTPYAGADDAPLGFEPEGACGLRTTDSCSSPPSYLKWARTLPCLLEDPEGVELFRCYLESEGPNYADTLSFWFACEGLKKQKEPEIVSHLVKVIYRRFFLKTQLSITEDLRKEVNQKIKDSKGPIGGDVFDAVQREVERIINDTTYPNFLKSDIYLKHVQSMQASHSFSTSSGSSSAENVPVASQGMLPTLHEDAELSTSSSSDQPLPLTRDMLLVTQKRRAAELRPKPEAYAGVYLQHSHPPHYSHTSHFPHLLHGANQSHAAYSSYNPVSRQDSELQSLSSDARTESDNMSLTDSSVDGVSLGRSRLSKKQYLRHCRHIKESASINQEPSLHHTVIPRTYRIQKEQVHPMEPEVFAAILVEKLENVRREQDAQEKLDRKLQEGDCGMSSEPLLSPDCAPPRALADAIREKLLVEDDNCQDILDQHVSRVWSDLTPLRSPSVSSPRPKSPEGQLKVKSPEVPPKSRRLQSAVHPGSRVPHCARHSRKDKDVFSTFSSDSGNVHDFPEEHRHHLPKSKSMPDYQQEPHTSSLQGCHGDGRFTRSSGRDSSRRSSSKKGSTELTDSGVSVVSESSLTTTSLNKDSRVLNWLLESHDKLRVSAQGVSTSPMPPRHSSSKRPDRSGSLERSGVSWPGPAQPFVADPSMPPLPLPHTATQLEEARRRLMEEEGRRQLRFVPVKMGEGSGSGHSTLRKSSRSKGASAMDEFTTVVFSFCDEQFPYRTKIPGKNVTLKQFKEFLPKKGSYRFFFKTECEDLDTRVIQEEITDDHEVLPLWEGKIMAQVKPVE